jgi:acyl carrier protein
MIPASFHEISAIPLTPNGKIDRQRLTETTTGNPPVSQTYVPPANELQSKLAGIWKEVLELEREVGILDNFFELGGHSIRAIKILSRISRQFGITLGIKDLFEGPTIHQQANKLQSIEWLSSPAPDKPADREYEKMEI